MQNNRSFLVAMVAFVLFSSTVWAQELTKMRIGWQVPWATQGQIVQILKHSSILEKNGIQAEFIGRTYGPMLNELAIAGEVDVILTADQPAAALFSKKKGWIGIGRLMYNRTSTYVSPESAIKSLSDLKGKTIGIPIGAAAERVTYEALERVGIDPKKDVKVINLGIMEQGPIVMGAKDKANWTSVDALSGFDPTPAIFEAMGLIRVLDVGKVCSLVLMNQEILKKDPLIAIKMMQSIKDAYDFYRQNVSQANEWFMAEAQLKTANQEACNIAASIEPNVSVHSRDEIKVTFSEDDFILMQKGADFLAQKLNERVDMRQYVTNEFVSRIN
ncbi:MAG: ABC transporter substrate-binding protein [Candidatus Moraniibacteriota bacterium]